MNSTHEPYRPNWRRRPTTTDDGAVMGHLPSIVHRPSSVVGRPEKMLSVFDELRDRMVAFLSKRQVCLISTGCSEGAWAMPARYRTRGLEVECLLPCWADVTYYLEQNPDVLLVVRDHHAAGLVWLQYRGTARPVAAPDWRGLLPEPPSTVSPDDLYVVVHVTPKRIDLIDQTRGWGARETLDL